MPNQYDFNPLQPVSISDLVGQSGTQNPQANTPGSPKYDPQNANWLKLLQQLFMGLAHGAMGQNYPGGQPPSSQLTGQSQGPLGGMIGNMLGLGR